MSSRERGEHAIESSPGGKESRQHRFNLDAAEIKALEASPSAATAPGGSSCREKQVDIISVQPDAAENKVLEAEAEVVGGNSCPVPAVQEPVAPTPSFSSTSFPGHLNSPRCVRMCSRKRRRDAHVTRHQHSLTAAGRETVQLPDPLQARSFPHRYIPGPPAAPVT